MKTVRVVWNIPNDAPIKDVAQDQLNKLWTEYPPDERWGQTGEGWEMIWNWDEGCWWRLKYAHESEEGTAPK